MRLLAAVLALIALACVLGATYYLSPRQIQARHARRELADANRRADHARVRAEEARHLADRERHLGIDPD